jgi:hypothetical protein
MIAFTHTQYASWAFAICQLGIEIFGWVITILVLRQSEKLSPEAANERFTAYSGDVNRRLGEAQPQFAPGV